MKRNKNLSFKQLRKANLARLAIRHKDDTWSETDWACALAGEVGELCNFIKKRRRENFKTDKYKVDIKKEIADIQIYLDLLAAFYDLDLGEITKDKFNEVSKRWKMNIKL